jgi:hypothetical protein
MQTAVIGGTGRALLIVLVGFTLPLSACGGSGSSGSAAEAGNEGIDLGSVTAVELPSEFPDDLPLPDDAIPVFAAEIDNGSSAVWFASGHPKQDLELFFEDSFAEDETYEITWRDEVDASVGKYTLFSIGSKAWTASIYLGEGAPGSEAYTEPYSFYVEATQVESGSPP